MAYLQVCPEAHRRPVATLRFRTLNRFTKRFESSPKLITAFFVENVITCAKSNDIAIKRKRIFDEKFYHSKMVELTEILWQIRDVDAGHPLDFCSPEQVLE